jgi:hypothetical protein
VDILSDGEGAASPTWGDKGTIAGEYIDVSGMGTSQPEPTPVPISAPVPSVDLSAVLAKLDAIAGKVDALSAEMRALRGDDLDHIEGPLDVITPLIVELAARPHPAYVGALGMRLRLTPEEKK